MKLKNTICLILLSMSITVYAGPSTQPKKADADEWLADFRAARDKTGDALFLNDPVKRPAHTQVLMKLRDRAEVMFGDGDCTKAAELVNSYWRSVVSLMISPSSNPHINLSGIVTSSWEGGQSYASCRQLIDGIK